LISIGPEEPLERIDPFFFRKAMPVVASSFARYDPSFYKMSPSFLLLRDPPFSDRQKYRFVTCGEIPFSDQGRLSFSGTPFSPPHSFPPNTSLDDQNPKTFTSVLRRRVFPFLAIVSFNLSPCGMSNGHPSSPPPWRKACSSSKIKINLAPGQKERCCG